MKIANRTRNEHCLVIFHANPFFFKVLCVSLKLHLHIQFQSFVTLFTHIFPGLNCPGWNFPAATCLLLNFKVCLDVPLRCVSIYSTYPGELVGHSLLVFLCVNFYVHRDHWIHQGDIGKLGFHGFHRRP